MPIPWEADAPASVFSPTGSSWLPQPTTLPLYARDAQVGIPGSTLEFYRAALTLRREHQLGAGAIEWIEFADANLIGFRSGAITVVANTGASAAKMPSGHIVLCSRDAGDGLLPGDTTVWLLE
ncbi:hypothetical protein BH09ACT4_BH09ACT4_11190 [soil metagenome]